MTKKNLLWVLVAAILLVAVTITVICVTHVDKPEGEPLEDDSSLTVQSLSLVYATTAQVNPSNNTLTAEISAVVLPEDAPDKSVDWLVAWAPNATRANEDVAGFITVEIPSDGSTTATIVCHAPFMGDTIYVTAVTRNGGFTATATVEYVGYPQELHISNGSQETQYDASWSQYITTLDSNNTYRFDLTQSNIFNSVGEFTNYRVEIETHGGIDLKGLIYDSDGNLTNTNTMVQELKVQDVWESDGTVLAFVHRQTGQFTYAKATIEGNQLVIETYDALPTYTYTVANPNGKATYSFNGYTDGKIPYISVTVTELNSGISQTIHVRVQQAVESLVLTSTEYKF